MAGQGGKYSAVGAFNAIRNERDSALRNVEYWKKRAQEKQNVAWREGVWSGVLGTLLGMAIVSVTVVALFA